MKTKLFLAVAASAMLSMSAANAAPTPAQLAAVADKGRPEADTKRDADRKPAEMLEFAGVKPGQTVIDLIPGGGYFTRIFSKAVGPKGVVYAAYSPRPNATTKPAAEVLAEDASYGNIKAVQIAPGKLAAPTPADLVWTSQNYHDITNVPNIDMTAFNKGVFDALKPGGTYVVLDHVANPDTANATSTVHRIDPAVVRKEVESAGFKFAGESKLLRNASDDHTKGVFDGAIRAHTDQFIYKFTKPK
jgi:predicted methyltransferase